MLLLFELRGNASLSGNPDPIGDWFSQIEKSGIGVSTYHLRFYPEGRFDLYRILLHPRLKWEEKRYSGSWEPALDLFLLHIESCEMYTSPALNSRRALLRKFDCDHLKMKFALDGKRGILSPNEYGIHFQTAFYRPPVSQISQSRSKNPWKDSHWLRVFLGEGENLAWGIGVKWKKSKTKGEIWSDDKKLGIASIRNSFETSLEFRYPESEHLQTGYFFRYQ